MPQNDLIKRYVDAAVSFTAITQARAEALVKDLVKAGEVQADQARDAVSDLLERSRKSSENLLDTVRTEVRQQITIPWDVLQKLHRLLVMFPIQDPDAEEG